jgi:NAD+ kinase
MSSPIPSVPQPIVKPPRSPDLDLHRFGATSPSPPRVRLAGSQPVPRPSPLSRLNPPPDSSSTDDQKQDKHSGNSSSSNHLHVNGPLRSPGASRHTIHHHQGQTRLPPGQENYDVNQKSPCFIHSHLEKHGQLSDWLRAKAEAAQNIPQGQPGPLGFDSVGQPGAVPRPHGVGAKAKPDASRPDDRAAELERLRKAASQPPIGERRPSHTHAFGTSHIQEMDLSDNEDGGSLTRQLAETATGVREMSKQLGACTTLMG